MNINLQTAVDLLKAGQVCAIPTETVYGLAARYDNEAAIQQIFAIKKRPITHPLIMHISAAVSLEKLAIDIPPYVELLINKFWPGPLTIVIKKNSSVSDLISANQNTVAVRMPDHPLALELIDNLAVPIVAPSANLFCQTSPTEACHVETSLGKNIPILDGGACQVGIESTIVLTSIDNMTILRPGMITAKELQKASGVPCIASHNSAVKVPGQHHVHYQPKKPLYILKNIAYFKDILKEKENEKFYCLIISTNLDNKKYSIMYMPSNPNDYAQLLYKYWRLADSQPVSKILIELPPDRPEWAGIRDRIFKASSGYYS